MLCISIVGHVASLYRQWDTKDESWDTACWSAAGGSWSTWCQSGTAESGDEAEYMRGVEESDKDWRSSPCEREAIVERIANSLDALEPPESESVPADEEKSAMLGYCAEALSTGLVKSGGPLDQRYRRAVPQGELKCVGSTILGALLSNMISPPPNMEHVLKRTRTHASACFVPFASAHGAHRTKIHPRPYERQMSP